MLPNNPCDRNDVDVLLHRGKILSSPVDEVCVLHDSDSSESGNEELEQDKDILLSKKTCNIDSHHLVTTIKARSPRSAYV